MWVPGWSSFRFFDRLLGRLLAVSRELVGEMCVFYDVTRPSLCHMILETEFSYKFRCDFLYFVKLYRHWYDRLNWFRFFSLWLSSTGVATLDSHGWASWKLNVTLLYKHNIPTPKYSGNFLSRVRLFHRFALFLSVCNQSRFFNTCPNLLDHLMYLVFYRAFP